MKELTLNVQGMTCNHCLQAVEGALTELVGVSQATVNLGTKNVAVQFDESAVTVEQMKEAIEDQGFDVEA